MPGAPVLSWARGSFGRSMYLDLRLPGWGLVRLVCSHLIRTSIVRGPKGQLPNYASAWCQPQVTARPWWVLTLKMAWGKAAGWQWAFSRLLPQLGEAKLRLTFFRHWTWWRRTRSPRGCGARLHVSTIFAMGQDRATTSSCQRAWGNAADVRRAS